MLGLRSSTKACLFDLDGVLTETSKVHARAWKMTFDDFLRRRSEQSGEPFVPFDEVSDYERYVDGLPRYEGVAGFLRSRSIELPSGTESDPPDAETVHGLGNRKNELVLELIHRDGVEPYAGSVRYLDAVRTAAIPAAVVSSSSNCREVLRAAGIEAYFTVVVDGIVAERERLQGKPAPDTYLAAARRLNLPAHECAVFEDALAGVQAGRAGRFGLVVGVDRLGQATALSEHGADVVVQDLSELLDSA